MDNKSGSIEDVARGTKEKPDSVRRAVEWLKSKGYVSVNTTSTRKLELGEEGRKAASIGLPERRLVRAARKSATMGIDELRMASRLKDSEFNAALGRARRLGWLVFSDGGRVSSTAASKKELPIEALLQRLSQGPLDQSSLKGELVIALSELRVRPGMVAERESRDTVVTVIKDPGSILRGKKEETVVTPQLVRLASRRRLQFSKLDVTAPAPLSNPGREHPISRIAREVREVWVSMGFEEIGGPMVLPSFWVFDALFTPQDHPARDMQDTLYVRDMKSRPQDRGIVQRVKSTHEDGWKTGSTGWRYRWSEEESRRLVMRTHTTALSCMYLASHPRGESRVFTLGRVFRNESLDATHLFEFNQIEGVVSEKEANARKLLGYMTQFYKSLGFPEVRFNPTYFPYTEPSFEPLVFSKEMNKWVELGGSGVFRPEVVRPLGVKNNVLAWGFGLERIALVRFGLKDIRTIYDGRLSWLRGVRQYP